MNIDTIINYVAFYAWPHIYYFLFHAPWMVKLATPFDFCIKLIGWSIDISLLIVRDPVLLISSMLCTLVINLIIYKHTTYAAYKFGYFTWFGCRTKAYNVQKYIGICFYTVLAPFWVVYFVSKKAIQYTLITYFLLVFTPIYFLRKIFENGKMNLNKQSI